MLEIKSSLDWYKAEAELRKLGNMLPIFRDDINKITKHLSEEVKELSRLEVEARNTHKKSAVEKCTFKVRVINDELKKVHKYHLMSILGSSI